MTGVAGHIEIGDGAIIGGRSGVTKSIPAGAIVSGFPAEDHHTARRFLAAQKHLPGALRRIRELEERIRHLESRNDG
jgi:UDP-3-O-[3-hydroxymyristoyl] glucosamine N-acyltransferase